ncbi:putative Minor allergen Alt a [Hibiscus syriacus]|uniref:Minor allergen Alt a n=1 Tax=Hibiscus syriacus TaxID=106335 RepID=A0A6A2YMZ8_HIBSY|nr:putative Minor allergen Alt a [Hibiscus syriacus]
MAEILAALRSLMASHSPPLDALIVPSENYHQSEYVSDRDKRREFVSGFTGSAGLALITKTEARLWTDGRYFSQAMQQLSDDWQLMLMGEDPPVDAWMSDKKLVQTSSNLVDEVWKNRPPAEFAGRSVAEKLKDLREKLANEKACGLIITALDEVAWLYNIHGSDVSYCPVVHAFAIVTSNSALFYVDKRKISSKVSSSMQENGIEVREYGEVSSDVALLASNQLDKDTGLISGQNGDSENDKCEAEGNSNDLMWVDPASCCYAIFSKLDAKKVLRQQSPLALAKALKNSVELDGLKNAHIRDGAAVVQYIVWLDKQMQEIYGASGYFLEGKGAGKKRSDIVKLTEVTVSDKLEGFRASKEHFRGLSFPNISSVGPNAAIIHYVPEAETCAELDPDSIYLFDSGAQYLDGTTDITRTAHFGKPSAHGTGHGVGSYLYLHEGRQLITLRQQARNVPLQVSMTVTDEPGYYEDGSFGIRLENVLVIKEADTEFNFGDKGYLSFEHITWAPYQIKLIDFSLLTPRRLNG